MASIDDFSRIVMTTASLLFLFFAKDQKISLANTR